LKVLQNISLHYIFEFNCSGATLKLIKWHILWHFEGSSQSSNPSSGYKKL